MASSPTSTEKPPIIACPSCRARYRAPRDATTFRRDYRCYRCGTVFRPTPAQHTTPAGAPRPIARGAAAPATRGPTERPAARGPSHATASQATPASPARSGRRTVPARVAPPVRPRTDSGEIESARRRFVRRNAVLLTLLGMFVAGTLVGLPYYSLPIAERLRSPLHDWLKPSGYVGQSLGILAFLMFAFLWLYPLRKKFRWLAFTGTIGRWLDVHITVGILVPLLGAAHASWRFDGLIGLGYFSMLTVSLSGFVGRFLYTRIPHGRSGLELSIAEIDTRRNEIVQRIADTTGIEVSAVDEALRSALAPGGTGRGGWWAVVSFFAEGLVRWRAANALKRRWQREAKDRLRVDRRALREAVRLARREIALTQQLRMLDLTRRLFRYWHVAHRPVAITALVAVLIHVVVVASLGVTWLW